MAQFEFTSPDGQTYVVEGPDGATEAEAFQILQQQLGGQQPAQQEGPQQQEIPSGGVNPESGLLRFNVGPAAPQEQALESSPAAEVVESPFLRGLAGGVTDVGLGAANLVEQGLNAAGVGEGGVVRNWRGVVDQFYDRGYGRESSLLGEIAGNVAGTLPAAALRGGALVQGGVQGALLSEADSIPGIAGDAAIGAVSGLLGDRAVRGIASAISPTVSPYIQTLLNERVPLTMGQIARGRGSDTGLVGRAVGALEDRATSIPGVGNAIESARNRGIEGLNRAAINRALAPIGAELPDTVPVGREAISYAGNRLSRAYDELLPNIRATADDQLGADLAAIGEQAATMAPERLNQFGRIIQNDVIRFTRDGDMSGEGFKQIERRLGERIRRYGRSTDADQQELASVLQEVRGAIRDMAARQNPQYAPQLQAINEGWANLVRVERAARDAVEGVFTPGQLRTAVRQTDTSVRGRGVARGEALMSDLADASSAVLPSRTPNSGTADRGMVGLLMGGAFGLPAAVGAGAAALPYTRPGQAAMQSILTGRQGPVPSYISDLALSLGRPVSIVAPTLTVPARGAEPEP